MSQVTPASSYPNLPYKSVDPRNIHPVLQGGSGPETRGEGQAKRAKAKLPIQDLTTVCT